MLRYLVNNISKGGNYLLNIGPMANGNITSETEQRFKEMGAWITTNQEAIYNVSAADNIKSPKGIVTSVSTTTGKKAYYLYITDPDLSGEQEIAIPYNSVAYITQIDLHKPIKFSEKNGNVVVNVEKSVLYDTAIKVLKIELK